MPAIEVNEHIEEVQKMMNNSTLESLRKKGVWEDYYIPIRDGDSRIEILVVDFNEKETPQVQNTKLAKAILDITPHKKSDNKGNS